MIFFERDKVWYTVFPNYRVADIYNREHLEITSVPEQYIVAKDWHDLVYTYHIRPFYNPSAKYAWIESCGALYEATKDPASSAVHILSILHGQPHNQNPKSAQSYFKRVLKAIYVSRDMKELPNPRTFEQEEALNRWKNS